MSGERKREEGNRDQKDEERPYIGEIWAYFSIYWSQKLDDKLTLKCLIETNCRSFSKVSKLNILFQIIG